MEWYKTLTIHQKINLKELSEDICGIKYNILIKIFDFKQSIDLLHQKLQLEGFNV